MKRCVNVCIAAGIYGLFVTACTQSRVTIDADERAVVRIDSMRVAGITNGLQILMYADGAATVDFGSGGPRLLTDTIRLNSAPSYTLNVSDGAVHVEMVAGQVAGGGVIMLSGIVVDSDSQRVRAVGRHLVVEKGGRGIRVIDRGNSRLMR